MNNNIFFAALVAGVGVANYFLLRKSKEDIKNDIVKILPSNERSSFIPKLEGMERQELLDTYQLIYATLISKQKISDPALIRRLSIISKKYNTFT